ncbi:MAG: prephenate dehydrogenase [Actinomycetota bacterium]|nr:prephenate dehydrogenase [Actinomycetota bacterium]
MSLDPAAAAALGTVRIVGTGLLGTSIGLALTSLGTRVVLADPSPTSLSLAASLGAGEPDPGNGTARITVVAAPPDVTAQVVAAELAAGPSTTVTDVASVKGQVLRSVTDTGADLTRYVGGHPMAGRERSGPMAARGDLFLGRPWVICPGEKSDPTRVADVRLLAQALGASPVTMPAVDHDAAVALVSHVPQIASSLVAARLQHAADDVLALAGQGVRDVTRVAASDPVLWAQILTGNARPVVDVLHGVRGDLDAVIEALAVLVDDDTDAGGPADPGGPAGRRVLGASLVEVAGLIHRGTVGRERIPGKHGGGPDRFAVLTVVIPDEPGQLAALFADIGTAGVNVEELTLEHAPGRAVGLLEVSVVPGAADTLTKTLASHGWKIVG